MSQIQRVLAELGIESIGAPIRRKPRGALSACGHATGPLTKSLRLAGISSLGSGQRLPAGIQRTLQCPLCQSPAGPHSALGRPCPMTST